MFAFVRSIRKHSRTTANFTVLELQPLMSTHLPACTNYSSSTRTSPPAKPNKAKPSLVAVLSKYTYIHISTIKPIKSDPFPDIERTFTARNRSGHPKS